MSDFILELRNICKSFPGVKALDNVSFSIERGTVHALVGENGAGKSTLIKVLAGIYQPESGEMILEGAARHFKTPSESQTAGISVVHQEIKLSETLSVAENVFLGNLLYKGIRVDWKAMRERADEMLTQLGLSLDVNAVVSDLSVAQKQMVEICKAINRNCRLLIMDEPSATLTEKEQKVMFQTVKRLREQGMTIIYISHRLDEIFDLADNVTVLRDGCHVRTMAVSDVTRHDLVTMMVGREVVNEYPKETVPLGDTVLEVKDITRKGVLNGISFKLRRGEVLGVAGLVGAGRTELARAILGIDKIDGGEIYLNGQKVTIPSFREAIRKGFALVPEDRKNQGLVQLLSVCRNICMVNMNDVSSGMVVSEAQRARTRAGIRRQAGHLYPLGGNGSAVPLRRQPAEGGHRQVLLQDADIIILDEPTRGIDVGAKSEIYLLINDLVKSGKSVIMISSEIPEIVGMSDRVLVMHEGNKVGELTREEVSPEAIMALCV